MSKEKTSDSESRIWCVRRLDLFGLTTPKIKENLTKEEAETIMEDLQKKETCPIPIYIVSNV